MYDSICSMLCACVYNLWIRVRFVDLTRWLRNLSLCALMCEYECMCVNHICSLETAFFSWILCFMFTMTVLCLIKIVFYQCQSLCVKTPVLNLF